MAKFVDTFNEKSIKDTDECCDFDNYANAPFYKNVKNSLKEKRNREYLKFCLDWTGDLISKKELCEQFSNSCWSFADFILSAKRHKLFVNSMSILEYADDFVIAKN
jgi:hypothetical protein